MKLSDVRTPLAKVRGLGSAKDGTSHFLWQRLTALALIPLTLWFCSALMRVAISPDAKVVADWLSSEFTALMMLLLIPALFYHKMLGMQVIIEDYVHAPLPKYTLLIANKFVSFTLGVISVLAVLKLHFHFITPGITG